MYKGGEVTAGQQEQGAYYSDMLQPGGLQSLSVALHKLVESMLILSARCHERKSGRGPRIQRYSEIHGFIQLYTLN